MGVWQTESHLDYLEASSESGTFANRLSVLRNVENHTQHPTIRDRYHLVIRHGGWLGGLRPARPPRGPGHPAVPGRLRPGGVRDLCDRCVTERDRGVFSGWGM